MGLFVKKKSQIIGSNVTVFVKSSFSNDACYRIVSDIFHRLETSLSSLDLKLGFRNLHLKLYSFSASMRLLCLRHMHMPVLHLA